MKLPPETASKPRHRLRSGVIRRAWQAGFGFRHSSFHHTPRKSHFLAAGLAAWTFFGGGMPNKTDGAVMTKAGTTLPGQEYIDLAAQTPVIANSLVAVRRVAVTTGAVTYASGIQIDERHVLTAAHVMNSTSSGMRPIESVTVIYGNNAIEDGIEVPLLRYAYHPSYNTAITDGPNGIDLAILELAHPVPGRSIEFAESIPANFTTLICAGYGRPAIPGGVLQAQDGYARSWHMKKSSGASVGFDPAFYFTATSDASGSGAKTGYAASLDSGGMILTQEGKLLGITEAGSTTIAGAGSTVFLFTTTPEVHQFINDFRADSQTGTELPPDIDTDNNGFTQLQEYHLDNIAKNFRVGDSVHIDLSSILYPLPEGQSMVLTGLPKGLKFDPATGTITGIIKGLPGKKTPVRMILKEGKKMAGSLLFDLQVDEHLLKGQYQVLPRDAEQRPVGLASLKVTGLGGFTATLQGLGEKRRTAKGSFIQGQSSVTFPPAVKGGEPAILHFAFGDDSDLVSGTTSSGHTLAGARLAELGRSAKQPLTAGFHPEAAGDGENAPAGRGYATGYEGSKGSIRLGAVLGDGQAVTLSLSRTRTDQAMFFVQPYKNYPGSFLGGVMDLPGLLAAAEAAERLDQGLVWRKTAPKPNARKSKSYPEGFNPSDLGLNARVSRWNKHPTVASLTHHLGMVEQRAYWEWLNAPDTLTLPAMVGVANGFRLNVLAPEGLQPFSGKINWRTGAVSGKVNGSNFGGVLTQEESSEIGAGLLKTAVPNGPKGSYRTSGLIIQNGEE